MQLDQPSTYCLSKRRHDIFKIDNTQQINDLIETTGPRKNPQYDYKYFTSGFIYLQDRIEQAIIKNQTGRQQLPRMYMQQFPFPCYVDDKFFDGIASLFPLFMILAFVFNCAITVKSIVYEKEKRLKETMRTMGLSNGVHWIAWFIDSFSTVFLASILLSAILVVSLWTVQLKRMPHHFFLWQFGKILEHSDFFLVLVFVLSFSIVTISLSFLITVFFNQANLAATCGGFIFLITYLPVNLFEIQGRSNRLDINILMVRCQHGDGFFRLSKE